LKCRQFADEHTSSVRTLASHSKQENISIIIIIIIATHG